VVIPLSGRVLEELLDPPDLTSTMAAAYSRFHGKVIGPFKVFPLW
jgi:hypothetical protein